MLSYNTLQILSRTESPPRAVQTTRDSRGTGAVGHLQLAVTNSLCDQTQPTLIGYSVQLVGTIVIVVNVSIVKAKAHTQHVNPAKSGVDGGPDGCPSLVFFHADNQYNCMKTVSLTRHVDRMVVNLH
jgi:hypothetical protein